MSLRLCGSPMPSSGGASEGPLIANPAHASHFMVERQERKRRQECGQGEATDCGHPSPVWFTDSRLWNEVMSGDPDRSAEGVLCPSCFADRADKHFDGTPWMVTGWRLVPDVRRR